jgi:arylsulfatase A-like enzyme
MSESKEKMNILLIHTDQHRWDCMGAYGNADIRTPHMDQLAADGVKYTHSFTCYPVCTPSRMSLLTGMYVHQHLGWSNTAGVPNGLDTFPRLLREAGYRTRAIGKMHLTPQYQDVGYGEFFLTEKPKEDRRDTNYYVQLQDKGIRNMKSPKIHWGFGAEESFVEEKDHITTWIGDRAVETIEQWEESGGNMLFVGFNRPHRPFDPPAPWNAMYDPDQLTLLPGWTDAIEAVDAAQYRGNFAKLELTEDRMKLTMAYYYACISQVDHHIGRMIDLLKQKGLYDKTLILYTSDHGEFLGFHHMVGKGHYMYDPLMRVPLLIKFPGLRRKGEVVDGMISNVDVATTVLRVSGLQPGPYMDGLDLAEETQGREWIFGETGNKGRGGKEYMVRSAKGKLLLRDKPGESQFFDLLNDPMELNNRMNDPEYEQEIARYKQALTQWVLFEAPTVNHCDENAPTI